MHADDLAGKKLLDLGIPSQVMGLYLLLEDRFLADEDNLVVDPSLLEGQRHTGDHLRRAHVRTHRIYSDCL